MARRLEGEQQVLDVTDGSERCAMYCRFSSTAQRKASIDDQVRTCREGAAEKGWAVLDPYIMWDEGKTGQTIFGRKGFQNLIALAKSKPKPFDRILIEDTSRMGRNMADVFRTLDILDYHGVYLYFVNDELDSKSESFRDAFTQKVRADEQFSKTHGKRVRRGRRGRFIEGYNPGGGGYGYKNIRVEDFTAKGENGLPGIKGMKQVIDPEEETVVLRIFVSNADGMSERCIAEMLNEEGIPTSQSPRTNQKPTWSKSAVHAILNKERYTGKLTEGRTVTVRDPETGRKEQRVTPESTWKTREEPELRIVSIELWNKVHELRKLKSETIGVQRSGGLSRTEASRKYLLGGLLKCGVCGGNMVIRSSSPPRYACAIHQYRGSGKDGCKNRVTLRLEDLERTFIHALGENLRSEDLGEELVQALYKHLSSAKCQWLADENSAGERRKELEVSRGKQARELENLVKFVKEGSGSRSILGAINDVEASIARIDDILASYAKAPVQDIRIDEVREFVNSQAHAFEELLAGTPERLKLEFQRRIKEITLTPIVDEREPVYHVSGDVELFSLPEGVLQTNQVNLIGLQHSIPIAFEIVPYRRPPKWALPQAA